MNRPQVDHFPSGVLVHFPSGASNAQGEISSGKAAQLLGMSRDEFIRYASQRGVPYFQLSPEELGREVGGDQSL
jgi:Uncharacterised protein family (UPF0175)